MKRPVLSVVIPSWNRAHLVCDSIESALSQGDESVVEVVVIDDGSTDGTAKLLGERFGGRIRLVRITCRTGISAARNAGVKEARGDLLAFLDSDDLWLPGKLNAELSVLERFPDAEAVVSDSAVMFEGKLSEISRFERNGALAANRGHVGWLHNAPWPWMVCPNGISIGSITLRRSAVSKLGQPLFAVDLGSCEDWELEVRVYQECAVVVLPEVWTHVRRIDDQTRIGRACPGTPLSRKQELGLIRDRLTAMDRSINIDKLTAVQADAFRQYRATQLARLEETGHGGIPTPEWGRGQGDAHS